MAPDRAKVLTNKRATIKGSVTRYKNFIQSLTPESRFSIHDINNRREKLTELYMQFDEVQGEIEILAEENLAAPNEAELAALKETQGTQRNDFETAFFQTLALYDERIRAFLTPNVNTLANTSSVPVTGQPTQHAASRQEFSVHLPKLELKTFSGEYHEWRPFHDYYTTTIHSNTAIPTIHKFQYSRSCLKGSAAEVIESLELTDANYTEAWDMLKTVLKTNDG